MSKAQHIFRLVQVQTLPSFFVHSVLVQMTVCKEMQVSVTKLFTPMLIVILVPGNAINP